MAVPSPENLELLGQLLDAGTLRVPIQSSYGLDSGRGGPRVFGTAHTQGKISIQVA